MRTVLGIFVLLVAPAIAAAQAPSVPSKGAESQTPSKPPAQPAAPRTHLKVGQPAPDFTLTSTIAGPDGRKVRYKLSDFKGKKNVVLAFYVFAFTGG
jgi:peroxiredoxin (alkyl hydroperoxide reductase subunit C)